MGQLYILDFTKRGVDITKSRKHRDGGSALDWRAYNATRSGLDHPKGPDGRFVDGHPSVGILGDIPDFVHRLSDADLKRTDEQANSLIRALTAEKGRRGVAAMAATQKAKPLGRTPESRERKRQEDELWREGILRTSNPAKPLKATRPAKEIPAELAERVEAIRKRPIPSDRAYLEDQLPKLTVAQLGELGRFGDWADLPPVGKTKADKVQDVIRRLTNRLTSEAVTHQSSAKGRDHYDEYRRRLAAAEARGDRDEYAALVAGFGTGGTGPGLPPEKARRRGMHPEPDPVFDALYEQRMQHTRDELGVKWTTPGEGKPNKAKPLRSTGGDTRKAQLDQTLRNSANPTEVEAAAKEWEQLTGGERHQWIAAYRGDFARMAADNSGANRKASAGAVADRIGELGSEDEIVAALGGKGAAELRRVGAELGIRFPSGMKDPDALRAHIGRSMMAYGSDDAKPNPAKPLRAAGAKPGHLTPATHDVIAGMIANPISADRERLKTMLSAMTLPQIKKVSERHGNGNLLGANKKQKVNQLVEHLIGHKLNSAAIQGGNWNGNARMNAIASIAANPKSGDQERLAGWLNNLKAPELPEVAARYGVKLTGRTKKEKIDQLVDDLVQSKLNSQAIRGGVGDALDIGNSNRAFRGGSADPKA